MKQRAADDVASSSAAAADTATSPRRRLATFTTPQHLVDALLSCKQIMVVTGAGISVNCGIPDFRSKDSGLYHTLDCEAIGIPSAELLFDYEYFAVDPEPFYRFARSLLPRDDVLPSYCHRFIALLEARKKLLRNYTQNVDGIEKKAGIKKMIECHGSIATFRCMCCRKKCALELPPTDAPPPATSSSSSSSSSSSFAAASVAGTSSTDATTAPAPEEDPPRRRSTKKAASGDGSLLACVREGSVPYCASASGRCGGVMKPEITFFGEALPEAFFKAMAKDVDRCDLVVVVGTSLKVGGSVHHLLRHVGAAVPQVLINRDAVAPPAAISEGFDLSLLGDCDDVVRFLCGELGWPLPPLPPLPAQADASGSALGKRPADVEDGESGREVHGGGKAPKSEEERGAHARGGQGGRAAWAVEAVGDRTFHIRSADAPR